MRVQELGVLVFWILPGLWVLGIATEQPQVAHQDPSSIHHSAFLEVEDVHSNLCLNPLLAEALCHQLRLPPESRVAPSVFDALCNGS